MGRLNANNTSQRHGNDIENLLKASWMFAGATNVQRTGQEAFDIEGECDPVYGLATSIKTSKGDWIGLADAERFCLIDRPWRLLYVSWEQETPRIKSYKRVHDMIIPLSVMTVVLGEMTPELALAFHNDIASFVEGPDGAKEARKRAAQILGEMEGRTGLLRLDFKIDDRKQRRLQFSIRFSKLEELLAGLPDYWAGRRTRKHHVVHEEEFQQYLLPIRLKSPPRRIETDSVAEEVDAILFDHDEAPRIKATDMSVAPRHASQLRCPPPVRREERERLRRTTANAEQIALFG